MKAFTSSCFTATGGVIPNPNCAVTTDTMTIQMTTNSGNMMNVLENDSLWMLNVTKTQKCCHENVAGGYRWAVTAIFAIFTNQANNIGTVDTLSALFLCDKSPRRC